ncbi:MAG: serine/threonine-protein kinase [Anaeromyxobacter sp.]
MADAAAPDTAAKAAEFKPHLFGKFFLLQQLAVGGMAEIYRARVPGAGGFEKELVVKRILKSRAQDEGFVKMLIREAMLTVQLTHSNIAQIYECGLVDGTYYISMELVNGVSMKEMMQAFARAGQAISPEQAIYLVLQLLQGLDYAHRKVDAQGNPLKVVHCDVSPDNALVSYEGEVKVLDFGIARAAAEGLSNYKEGMLMGKLGYVAPEQASLEKRWDHRVDIFAAGIILYELLTKQKPFPKATDVESLIQARKAKVVPPTAIDPRLPKDIDAVVAKALAYDPEKRYADARSFVNALVDLLFPTPQSSIQDLLGQQMKTVFGEKIAKQRSGRAHDPLIMKVLSNAAAAQAQGIEDEPRYPAQLTPNPTPLDTLSSPDVTPGPSSRMRSGSVTQRPRPIVKKGVPLPVTLLVGLAVGVAGAVGIHLGQVWLRPGVVMVTSEPPGAEISLDGKPTGLRTPAVVEGVALSKPHEISLAGDGMKTYVAGVKAEPGALMAKIHAKLQVAVGELTVESDPPGARVKVNDHELAGRTPLRITGVRLDEQHRIDLLLDGYELDQFVIRPEKDGTRFTRKLVPAGGKAP